MSLIHLIEEERKTWSYNYWVPTTKEEHLRLLSILGEKGLHNCWNKNSDIHAWLDNWVGHVSPIYTGPTLAEAVARAIQ